MADGARPEATAALVVYREFAPMPALRAHVRALFSFVPGPSPWRGSRTVTREVRFGSNDSFCSPQFADGRASLVVDLGAECTAGAGWTFGAKVQAQATGALRSVGAPAGDVRSAMVGAYLEPGAVPALFQVPAGDLTDRAAGLDALWGSCGARLAEDLAAADEAARIDRLEAALLARAQRTPVVRTGVDVIGLARLARANPATMTARRLAEAADVSSQHLRRLFRDVIGVGPKRYCRLVRFHAGLAYAGGGARTWAEIAAGLGYADQSHMIAAFREFSGLTPDELSQGRWFHPFILEARFRHSGSV